MFFAGMLVGQLAKFYLITFFLKTKLSILRMREKINLFILCLNKLNHIFSTNGIRAMGRITDRFG